MSTSPPTILETIRAWSADTPDQEALVFLAADGSVSRLTYGELQSHVEMRAVLLRQLPLQSRVGLIAPHGPEFLLEALAILAAGHCLVPISHQLTASQRDKLAERAGIHALRDVEKCGLIMAAGQPIDLADDEDFRALSPAYLRFTSGSTGQRKGVLLSHSTILERTAAANARLKISPADCVLCLLPMVDHFVVSILLYLRYGATVLLVENDTDAAHFAHTQMATVLYGSPTQYREFRNPLPHVRLAVSTTQGLSEPVAQSFFAHTGCPLAQALGIIEVGLLTLNEDRAETEPFLAGVPMPAYQLTIVSDGGRDGEIHVTGPGLLDAYVSPWRSGASLLTAQGFPTGDHGWLDDSGCLHLVGREKNRIVLNGVPFFCEEIEACVNQHPDVLESLVFVNDNGVVVRVVVQNAQASLAQAINERLAFLRTPIRLEVVPELPRTPTGKVARPING